MFKYLIIIISFWSLVGCSTVSSKSHFENIAQTAKRSVEKRELTIPDDFKTGDGNADDIKKGVKHSVNESLLFLFVSFFNEEY